MASIIPAAINLHTQNPDNDPLSIQNIGVSNRGSKSGGNLPLTTDSAECNNGSVGTLQGTAFGLPTNIDSTTNTKVVVWAFQFNAPNRIQVDALANDGAVFRLYSGAGSGNFRQFRVGGNDTPLASSQNGPVVLIADPQSTGFQTETGTFDPADWSGYGLATTHLKLQGGSSTLWFVTRAFIFGTEKDAPDIPKFTGSANFDDIITVVLGTDYTNKIHNFVARAGKTYTLQCPFQFGDGGTTATTFTADGVTVLSPTDNDPTDPRFHISNQAMRTHCSTVTLAITDSSFIWGTAAVFDWIDSDGVSTGCTFTGMGDFLLGADTDYSNSSFNLNTAAEAVSAGATINKCTFSNLRITTAQTINGVTVTGNLTLDASPTILDSSAASANITAPGTYDLSVLDVSGTVTVDDNVGAVTIIKGSQTFTVDEGSNNTVTVNDQITVNFILPEAGGALAIQNIDDFDVYLGEYADDTDGQTSNPTPNPADYYRVAAGTYTRWDGSQWIGGFAEATEVEIDATLLGGPGALTTQPALLTGGANYRVVADLFGFFRNGVDFVATSGQDIVIPMTPNPAPDVGLLSAAAPIASQIIASHPDTEGTIEVQVPDMSGQTPQTVVTAVEIAQLNMEAQRGAVSTGVYDLIEVSSNVISVKDDRTQIVPLATYPAQTPVQLPVNLDVIDYNSIDPTPYDANNNRVFFDDAAKTLIEGASVQGNVASNIQQVLGVPIADASDILNPDSID